MRTSATALAGGILVAIFLPGCYGGVGDPSAGGSEGDGGGSTGATPGDDAGDDDASAESGGSTPLSCDELDPGPAPVRRLTRDQLAFTIQDVLGVDASEAVQRLPEDLREDGFTNTASALVVTFAHVQALRTLADEITDGIPDFEGFVGAHAPCTDLEPACEEGFIASIGLRLFRRPPTATEIELLREPFDVAAQNGDGFAVGARLALTSMLQAPPFLYRLEAQSGHEAVDGLRALDGYELASRLSYLLWSSAPDEALLDRAEAGELSDADVLAAEAERMLDDPKARRVTERYARDWLGLDRLDHATRDDEAYPEFTPALARAMKAETLDAYDAAVWREDAPLWSLLTRRRTTLSPALAEFYGLTPSSEEPAEYELDELPERVGILTHAGVLAVMSDRDEPSLVERALFIYEDVLCSEIGTPPPGIEPGTGDAEVGTSQRARSEARVADPQCGACHGQFDAMAYALTQFDAAGAHREVDELGNALRSDGTFEDPRTDDPPVPFETVEEFMTALSQSPSVTACMTRKHLQFTLGRPLEPADGCATERIVDQLRAGGGTWRELALSIVTDPTFSLIRAE